MTRDALDPFEYDVALSFASADKAMAEELANRLRNKQMNVFLDEYRARDLWGKDVVAHLVNIYARKARDCILFVSQHYPLNRWTEAERASARERAFRDPKEHIFPVRLDDTEVPGLEETPGYRDLRHDSMDDIVKLLEEKLAEAKSRSGPPPSHDLRSGNIHKSS